MALRRRRPNRAPSRLRTFAISVWETPSLILAHDPPQPIQRSPPVDVPAPTRPILLSASSTCSIPSRRAGMFVSDTRTDLRRAPLYISIVPISCDAPSHSQPLTVLRCLDPRPRRTRRGQLLLLHTRTVHICLEAPPCAAAHPHPSSYSTASSTTLWTIYQPYGVRIGPSTTCV